MKAATTFLVFCVGALTALGMVILYSAGMVKGGHHYLAMQMAWGGIGLVACFAAAAVDYRILKKFAWVFFAIAIVLLILVLIPGIGSKINGGRRWFKFGALSFQPSEFAKLALIIFLAWYGERYSRQMGTFWRGVAIPGLLLGLAMGLLFMEPDVGMSMLLGMVGVVMLFVAGIKLRYILPPGAAVAGALGIFLWLDPVRSSRISSWLNLEQTKMGTGMQVWQSLLAFGSGGWNGVGLGNGRQKYFVPDHHTDFIFSVVGEELGVLGTLGVILAFAIIVICAFYIACHARDTFGLLLGSGITFMIGIQAFINMAVVSNVLPNKGLPLPFISYGGSNLLLMLTCVGLLLSVARHSVVQTNEDDASVNSRGALAQAIS
jgi:cell division protein FtsW